MVDTLIELAGTAAMGIAAYAYRSVNQLQKEVDAQGAEIKRLTDVVDLKLTNIGDRILERFDTVDRLMDERTSRFDALDGRLDRLERFFNGHFVAFKARQDQS